MLLSCLLFTYWYCIVYLLDNYYSLLLFFIIVLYKINNNVIQGNRFSIIIIIHTYYSRHQLSPSLELQCSIIINPRRACAARVTVPGLCVCLRLFSDYRLRGGYERYQQLQCYKSKKNKMAILLKRRRVREIWCENKRKSQYA